MDLAFLDTDDPGFLADPHPVFDHLRDEHAGVTADRLGLSLLSYHACEAAFHDSALVPGIDFLLEELGHGPLWGTFDRTLTDSEGADHQRLRRALSPWFTARRIDGLRLRTRQLVGHLLDRHDADDPLDVMADLADRVPSRLFCWMIGADPADAELLARWSKALLLVFTATPSMVEPVRAAKAELFDYTRRLLDRKRREPEDDLASALADATRREVIDADDALYLMEELLSASVDNTANTIGLATHTLATHPAQWAALHTDPGLLGNAVEECGRYQPAIRHTIKYATGGTDLAGYAIPEGTFVTVRIAAAHRDPAVFPDPHEFDITRKLAKPQLAFGAGRHYCLGAALGRMEVQEAVSGLVTRWSSAAVGNDARMSIVASGHVAYLPLELTT